MGTYLLPQCFNSLLLCMGVDVGANDKGHDVEERYPCVLGQEFLRKGQRDRTGDPADSHDWYETSTDGRTDLVPIARTGDDGHGGQIDGVLNRCNLNGWIIRISICNSKISTSR